MSNTENNQNKSDTVDKTVDFDDKNRVMTDGAGSLSNNSSNTENSENYQKVKVKNRKSSGLSHVWWIPFISLVIGVYLTISYFNSKGPLVTITFLHADGVAASKTKIKYKDVEVGQVEKVYLSEDLSKVIVSARFNKGSENLLKKDSRFWIVRPRLELTKISGLDTLLSGSYITVDPGKAPESEDKYKGLDEPPIITQKLPGLHLTLLSQKSYSISPGTSIYYNGIPVGTVERKYFSDDYLWVKMDVFIATPNSQLINSHTKFWSTNGVTLSSGADGFEVQMESLESAIAGGIAFSNPPTLAEQGKVKDGDEFILFANEKESASDVYGEKILFVSYFNGSVKGLNVGDNVEFKGIPIGKVKDIRLIYNSETGEPVIPVLFEIYKNRLSLVDKAKKTSLADAINSLINKGLRAKLETSSLITGSKVVSLNIYNNLSNPNDYNQLVKKDSITGYIIMPSATEDITAITSGIADLVDKINKMPIAAISENINKFFETTNGAIGDGKLDNTVKNLNLLLKKLDKLSGNTDKTLTELSQTLNSFKQSSTQVLNGLSPDAPLYYNLNNMIKQVDETMQSLKNVTNMLDRTPNALVFGEKRKIDVKVKPTNNKNGKKQ